MKQIKDIMYTLRERKWGNPEEVDIFFEKCLNELYNLGKQHGNKS